MTQTVSVTRRIRCAADEASAFVTDMHKLVPAVSTFKRCKFIGDSADGQLWDVFMRSGTIYLGGRVAVTAEPRRLSWRSISGTRHWFEAVVEDDPIGCRITFRLTISLYGWGTAWFSELIGRGIVSRHLEAAAEEVRHHLEFER